MLPGVLRAGNPVGESVVHAVYLLSKGKDNLSGIDFSHSAQKGIL
jgi:hypothetical protein